MSTRDESIGSRPSTSDALVVHGVTKRFGGLVAVRDVTLAVRLGERRVLIGPNGAGKTTLFNLIAGDLAVSGGRIELFAADVTALPVAARVRRGLRRTYQTSALFDELSVGEHLYLGLLGPRGAGHFDMLTAVRRQQKLWRRIEAAAARVGLESRLATLARTLSHGERRQLEIGLALCGEPRLVLLDEPAAGLSPEERAVLSVLLRSFERNVTVLMIEHDMDVALGFADYITVLQEGAVVAEGAPEAVVANPVVQEAYLGRRHSA